MKPLRLARVHFLTLSYLSDSSEDPLFFPSSSLLSTKPHTDTHPRFSIFVGHKSPYTQYIAQLPTLTLTIQTNPPTLI